MQWPTVHAAAPFSGTTTIRPEWLALFRLTVTNLSEEMLITGCLAQGSLLGLGSNDTRRLQGLFDDYYKRMRQAPVFRAAPSALPYCFADRKPTHGLATVHVPAQLKADTPIIVFIHGFGGSLLAYVSFLAESFPDHLIICPAYGVTPANIPVAYLREAQRAVAERLKIKIERPVLMGLSAGGWGACRVYAQAPGNYRHLIVLGAYPPEDLQRRWNSLCEVRFLCGAKEDYVANGFLSKQLKAAAARGAQMEAKTIADADHFFMLSHEAETKNILRDWMRFN